MERAQKHRAEKRRSSSPAPEAGPSPLALHQSVGNQVLQRSYGASAGVRVWEGGGADRMLHSLGAAGAALGPDILVSSKLDWKTRKSVLAHELTHARQTGGRTPSGGVHSVGARGGREERQARVAGAIGVPLGGGAATADPGVLRLFDPNELIYGRITDAWVQGLDDDELVEAGAGLRDEIELLAPDTAEYADAAANNGVIERELVARGLDSDRREDLADMIAADPMSVPVAFGVDSTTDEVYVTVTPPGADLQDVASYLYGTPALADVLAETNGLDPHELLAPGTVLRMLPDQRSIAAEDALEAGFETGSIIQTEGIPEALEDTGQIYYFDGPSGLMMLNCGQLNALLTGIRDRTLKEIGIYLRALEGIFEIRNSHEEKGVAMRNLIEWWGEVELPSRSRYESWISTAKSTVAEVEELVFEDDPRATACTLLALQRRGCEFVEAEQRIANDQLAYFYGFMSGGADLVGKLEFARNVSLGLVAGIAGALVAPAAFAALAAYGVGTGAATVLSIGAAGLVGGTARGTLEAAPYALLGEEGAGDRFASGFYSGTIEGATGGVGSFMTPLVTGAVTSRLAATGWGGQAFVHTARGQMVTQGATGAIIGAPSGMVGSALENLPEFATGEMSGGDYAAGIGWGGVSGGLFGAAAPVLPGKGVYRSGKWGLKGEPVTPEWMLAGPYAPLTAPVRVERPEFHDLPEQSLPVFSEDPGVAGYNWTRLRRGGRDEWVPVRLHGQEAEFEAAWYGDSTVPADSTNFNFLYGPAGNPNALGLVDMRQTLLPRAQHYNGLPADTPEIGMPRSTRADMPARPEDMAIPLPDGTMRPMIVGHNVDFKYTAPRTATIADSNLDIRNIIPEPWGWGGAPKTAPANLRGFGGREMLIGRMMRARPEGGTQIRQVAVYGNDPLYTVSGKPAPDYIYFIEVGPNGRAVRAWEMPFNDPAAFDGIMMNRVAELDANFGMRDIARLPQVAIYEAARIPAWVLEAAGLERDEEAPRAQP